MYVGVITIYTPRSFHPISFPYRCPSHHPILPTNSTYRAMQGRPVDGRHQRQCSLFSRS